MNVDGFTVICRKGAVNLKKSRAALEVAARLCYNQETTSWAFARRRLEPRAVSRERLASLGEAAFDRAAFER